HVGQRRSDAFAKLEDYVADKTVAYDDVGGVGENVSSFEVSNEIDLIVSRENRIGLLRERVALSGLFADVEQSDGRAFDAEHMVCIGRAHDGELMEVVCLAVYVGPDIEDDDIPLRGRESSDDRCSQNTLDSTEDVVCDGQYGAGVAGACDGVDLAGTQEGGAGMQRRELFLPKCYARRLGHTDNVGGVDDGNAGEVVGMAGHRAFDGGSRADEDDFDAVVANGRNCAVYDHVRGVITANGVNCYTSGHG